jgi:steroid delta-isomerase-like uncharacterized protein
MKDEAMQVALRWFEEVWNQRKDHLIDTLMAPDGVGHGESGDIRGRAGFRAWQAGFLQAFPDIHIEIQGVVADGENVVLRWLATGTHTGDGLGVPASGRRIAVPGMSWVVVRDGQLVEGWDRWNQGAMMEQLRAPAGA